MRTSINGMLAILKSEAVVLSTYDDGVGVLTIGVGHTANAGGLKPQKGMVLTLRQCLELFVQDLRKFERGVLKAIDKVPMKQHEFDGFVGFHFNTGQIEKGTVDDKFEQGDLAGAIKTLKAYKKARGKVLGGLVARRQEEANLIVHGNYPYFTVITVADKAHRGKLTGVRKVPVDEIMAVLREIMASKETSSGAGAPPSPKEKGQDTKRSEEAGTASPSMGGASAGAAGAVVATGAAASWFGLNWNFVLIGGCIVFAIAIVFLVLNMKGKKP